MNLLNFFKKKKKIKIKNIKYLIFLTILLIIPSLLILNADTIIDMWNKGYKIERNATGFDNVDEVYIGNTAGTEITSECHKVTNTDPNIDYFIPTKTKGEWDAFDAHHPSSISIESCCTPDCDGKDCGDDGCGGSCGSCPADGACHNSGGTYCYAPHDIYPKSMGSIVQNAYKTVYDCNEGKCISHPEDCDYTVKNCKDSNQYCNSGDTSCAHDCECSWTGIESPSECHIYDCTKTQHRKGYVGRIYECDGCFLKEHPSLYWAGGGFACPLNEKDSCSNHECIDGYCEVVIGPCFGTQCKLPDNGENSFHCCLDDSDCTDRVTDSAVCYAGKLYKWTGHFTCQHGSDCSKLVGENKYCQSSDGFATLIDDCQYGCIEVDGINNDYCNTPSSRSCIDSSCSGYNNDVYLKNGCGASVRAVCLGAWTADVTGTNWSSTCNPGWENVRGYNCGSCNPCP